MLEKYREFDLVNNTNENQFELTIQGYKAFIVYKQAPKYIALIHTEVPKELEGQGVAAALVEKVFNYIEQHGLELIPLCPYVAAFLKKHPEWKRILHFK